MTRFVPFEPAHLEGFALQPGQQGELGGPVALSAAYGERLWRSGMAFTMLDRFGEPIASAGLSENHPGYATAWAFIAHGIGAGMVPLTRAVRRVLDAAAYPRVDTMVLSGFDRGHAWARRLGFARLCTMEKLGRDGADFDLYARIAGDQGAPAPPCEPGEL